MQERTKMTWSTGSTGRDDLRVSSGLVGAVRSTLRLVDGVQDVLLLHRNDAKQVSKFFVLLQQPSVDVVEQVVSAMVQLEEAFLAERFDYDTVPRDRTALVPSSARSVFDAAG